MSLPSPRRLIGALAAVTLAATTLVVTTAAVTPGAAEAATTRGYGYNLKAGPKLGRGEEWMGSWILAGHPAGYCVDYGKTTPAAISWGDYKSVSGWSTEQTARISYITNKWANTSSARQAAAVNAAVNITVGNANFLYDWKNSYVPQLAKIDANVAPLATKMINEAAAYRGPYKIGATVAKAAPVGGTAQVRLKVESARNTPLAAPLTVSLGNAMAAKKFPVRFASNGLADLQVVPSAPGKVNVKGTASDLIKSDAVRLSTPTSPAVQRLVSAGTNTRVVAAAVGSFTAAYPTQNMKLSMACTNDCLGAPPVKVTATNSSARNNLQVFLLIGGKEIATHLTLGPGKSSQFTATVHDGDKIQLAYRWAENGGWTRFIAYGAVSIVDCPPLAHVRVTVDCPCAGELVATVNDINTSRYTHLLTIVAAGKPNRTLSVAAGATKALGNITWARGGKLTIYNQNQLSGKNVGARYVVTTITFS